MVSIDDHMMAEMLSINGFLGLGIPAGSRIVAVEHDMHWSRTLVYFEHDSLASIPPGNSVPAYPFTWSAAAPGGPP